MTTPNADNGDGTASSNSANTPPTLSSSSPSILVTRHMPVNMARNKQSDWPLNTEDLSMGAESIYGANRVPPPPHGQVYATTVGSKDDEDDRILLDEVKSCTPSILSTTKSTASEKKSRWSRKKAAYGSGRLASSLHKKTFGRKKQRSGSGGVVLSDGEDSGVALAESLSKGCVLDPTHLLRLQQQRAAHHPTRGEQQRLWQQQMRAAAAVAAAAATAESAKTKSTKANRESRRRRTGGLLRRGRYHSDNDADDNRDDEDEISLAESFLQSGPASMFL
jgi:hypothetical protein